MSRQERIACQCGGTLTRPIPKKCPHCGKDIVALRQKSVPQIASLILVTLMFFALVLYVVWLVRGG